MFTFPAIFLGSCGGDSDPKNGSVAAEGRDSGVVQTLDSGEPDSTDEPQDAPPEITAGVGIGPARLGGSYGELVAQIGPPDSSFEYYRVIFAVWLELGIEVVFSAGPSAELSDDSPIVSVGTKLLDGFQGDIVPGMSRADAEALIGECTDVVDDVHCYHPIGLYLGFDSTGGVQTVAIHPPYTVRVDPPEMVPSEGGVR